MNKGKPILSYPEFDRLIPKARWTTESINRKAKLEDTLEFLPDGVERCKWQVAKIVPLLKGRDLEETCYNIWYHLYTAIRYNEDEKGKEQIKSPRRSWWGREADCDDFSVFVSCILCQMNIPHLFRIAKYSEAGGYQHIYVAALTPDGKEIIIDCVLNRFNRQVPFIEKIDKKMELQFLDGIGDEYQYTNGIDANDLLNGYLGDLGKGAFFKTLKKGLHALNKLNPATVLLRGGILLCMKLNILGVAKNLRYTYLTDLQAKTMRLIMPRLAKMKKVREKLEKIFYGAGGEEKNLKKAILKGRGNHDKAVPLSGLGSVDMNIYTAMHSPAEILGAEIYNSELAGFEELGALGVDPGSDSAIAMAMTAITALAVIIKKIGSLKPKGGSSSGGAADDSGTATPDSSDTNVTTASTDNSNGAMATTGGGANTDTPASATGTASGDGSLVAGSNNKAKAQITDPNADTTDTADASKNADGSALPANQKAAAPTGIMEWAKANKPAAIGIAAAVIALLGYGAYKLNSHGDAKAVSGVPKKKSKKGTNENEKLGKIKIQKLR